MLIDLKGKRSGSQAAVKLIQHEYLDNPWKMMIACVLLNRTTGTKVREVLPDLFVKYPTPYRMLEADLDDLYEIVRPLGFGDQRATRLVMLSHHAAKGRVVGTWPGIGRYAMDSWFIFVCGQWMPADDKELRSYMLWLRDNELQPPSYQESDGTIVTPKPLNVMRLKKEER